MNAKSRKDKDIREFSTRFPARTIEELSGRFDVEVARLIAGRVVEGGGKLKAERLMNAIVWAFLELPEAERDAIAAGYVGRFNEAMRTGGAVAVVERAREVAPGEGRGHGGGLYPEVPLEKVFPAAKTRRKKSGNGGEGAG